MPKRYLFNNGSLLSNESYTAGGVYWWQVSGPSAIAVWFTKDDEPVQAARRELEEELGLVAEDMQPLHMFYVNPGCSAWPVHLFLCTKTSPGHAQVDDPAEQVNLVSMLLAQLDALITAKEIVDPSLLIARSMAAATGCLGPITPLPVSAPTFSISLSV